MPAPNEITPNQLLRLIGTPNCPAIADICVTPDFEADPYLIPGSFRHPHTDVPGLIRRLDGRACVVVCQKGKKLSQGLVAWLRSEGIAAEYLSGGMFGWRDTPDAPRIPASSVPDLVGPSTLWVTRHRPKIGRTACPWLIRRFVDPVARFLFVSPAEVTDVAERFGAIPFDVEGAFWSHRQDACSFDTMIDEFKLKTDPLQRLARIVRGADTNRHDLAPQAAGLFAISVGLSHLYRDDQAQLKAGMELYDALYRWARDEYDESHERPAAKS